MKTNPPTMWLTVFVCSFVIAGTAGHAVRAAVTPEQKKELGDIRKDVAKVTPLMKRRKFDEAEAAIRTIEERVQAMGLDETENDRMYLTVMRQIATLRANFPVSFESEVAPILKEKCLDCHSGQTPRGRRPMQTFAQMGIAGPRGPLVIPRNPQRSLLLLVMAAPQQQGNQANAIPRMPQQGPAATQREMETVYRWIAQGAIFDGTNPNAEIGTSKPPKADGDMTGSPQPGEKPKVEVVKADGTETVSFAKDVAPWMNSICLRCHRGNNPRGGFSLETFEKLLQGGDTGSTIVAGKPDDSYIVDLVLRQDPVKMPQGQAVLRKEQALALETWIREGAKFDGGDSKKSIADLVPTAAEKNAAEMSNMSPTELASMRIEKAQAAWKRVLPNETPVTVETEEFYLMGNVSESRIKQVSAWADEHAGALRTLFKDKAAQLWNGRLAVFVVRDRFGYEEFNQVLLDRQTPREMTGHSVITANQAEAYVVLEDVGDAVSSTSSGLQISLVDHLTGAYLQRSGDKLPDWLVRGTGLALASKSDPSNEYIRGLSRLAVESIRSITSPDALFADGTFSPAEVGPVGYTLVSFLLKAESPARFGQLIQQLQSGASVADAAASVYRTTLANLAKAYGDSVSKGR